MPANQFFFLCMQVKIWDRTKLYNFWQKWYFPANATLFIVGDISTPSALRDAVKCIEKSFGSVPVGKNEDGSLKVRHLGLPPVRHAFGLGDLPPGVTRPVNSPCFSASDTQEIYFRRCSILVTTGLFSGDIVIATKLGNCA